MTTCGCCKSELNDGAKVCCYCGAIKGYGKGGNGNIVTSKLTLIAGMLIFSISGLFTLFHIPLFGIILFILAIYNAYSFKFGEKWYPPHEIPPNQTRRPSIYGN